MVVLGFVLVFVIFIFNNVVFLVVLVVIGFGGSGWLMYFWLVLNILSIVFFVVGMIKLKCIGGKCGFGIVGMVIGIVGMVWVIFLIMGIVYGDS